jgi:hypothetical protein
MAAGTEAKEMCLVHRPGGGKVVGWEETPSEPESSGGDDKKEDEDEEVGEVTPPPHSPLREALPSLGDIFTRQAGIVIGTHWPKRPRTEAGLSTG